MENELLISVQVTRAELEELAAALEVQSRVRVLEGWPVWEFAKRVHEAGRRACSQG